MKTAVKAIHKGSSGIAMEISGKSKHKLTIITFASRTRSASVHERADFPALSRAFVTPTSTRRLRMIQGISGKIKLRTKFISFKKTKISIFFTLSN